MEPVNENVNNKTSDVNENVNNETSDVETENLSNNESGATKNNNKTIYIPEKEKVDKLIRECVYASMGIGIVPLPFFNVAAVTASNLNLTRKLSSLYRVEFKEGVAKKIIIAVTGAGVSTLATPLIESVVSSIPLIGLPLVIGTKPALNGMITYSLSHMFINHFERGGSFLNANIESMKEDFASAYKNSREWLGSTISGKKNADTANT